MNIISFSKCKLALIYKSTLTYLMLGFQILFLVFYVYINKANSISDYAHVLKMDFFLWLIYVPAMTIQHKAIVFTTYFNLLSRIGNKKRMIIVDYVTMAISTAISSILVICIPMLIIFIQTVGSMSEEITVSLLFFVIRYTLLGTFIQYIIYTAFFMFPVLQKKNGGICLLPFILYFIFVAPMDFLAAKSQYISFLDFSAGKNYIFVLENDILWESVILYNIHLIGYLVLFIWLSSNFISRKWEFLENASSTAY